MKGGRTIKVFLNFLVICVLFFIFVLDGDFSKISEVSNNVIDSSNYKSNSEKGVVETVIDGDTLVVKINNHSEKVRMLLIDTPESVKRGVKPQKFSKEASNYLKERLTKGKKVYVEKGKKDRDKYNRLLAYIWLDGENINKTMVQKGYARIAYVSQPNTKYLNSFKNAEETAKKEKRKIWSIDGYVTNHGFISSN